MRKSEYRRSDLLRGSRIPAEVLQALPKADLHCHLDGSLRVDTFLELGRQIGAPIPDNAEELRRLCFPADHVARQEEFLEHFDLTQAVMQDPDNVRRVARELALDAAAVGCWYLEVRFCPLLHTRHGMSLDEAVGAVRLGLQDAESQSRILTGIIITGLRTISADVSLQLAELAVAWNGRGVVAFDLAGAEEHYPAKDHREAFYHVMNNNLNSTIHAGENFGPASIHQALHYCGANRIGHGTRLHEDPDLLHYVNDHRIPLEVCLSSNLQTGVVSDLTEHPFRYYLDLGLRVTVNTDNTLFNDTTILGELQLAVNTFDLTLLETENLLLKGFKSAFLSGEKKADLVLEAVKHFATVRDDYRLDELDLT